MKPSRVFVLLFSIFLAVGLQAASKPVATKADPLLTTMQRELHRASTELAKAQPAPYYLSYTVRDQDAAFVAAGQGAIISSLQVHGRLGDVVTRVGSPTLDNSHNASRGSTLIAGSLPLDDDEAAITRTLWQLTNRGYLRASRAYLQVKTSTAVRAEEEDTSADFSQEQPQTHEQLTEFKGIDAERWKEKVRAISRHFSDYPEIEMNMVMLSVQNTKQYFVSTEGSRIVSPSQVTRLYIMAAVRADDGMQLFRFESFLAPTPEQLPADSELVAKIVKIAADLKMLRTAAIAEPYNGPALLSGRAAAVMTHEVLGHRLEGQRQRGDDEGQTFTKKVNGQVLPEFLSVMDDPTKTTLNGITLAGNYEYDDEGVPAKAVKLIEAGVLKDFLMSRMPVKNFDHSNGHGRSEGGRMPTGRQGNLIVASSKTVTNAELRQKFIAEIKKQGKPYGLYFDDIQGGFTMTEREMPQAFQVLPIMVWRVYADGRPDELVRGVDIVGTPLAAFGHIIAAGDTTEVFNGICGAESGQIPVSAASPSLLFSELETQRRSQEHDRPPILPPPPMTEAVAKGGAQ
jgi:TldD protein